MVKFVVLPLLFALLAMHTSVNAYGVVRVEVQKDRNFVNAINNAISSKIQSLNTFWNSILQAKLAYGTTATVRTNVNYIPIYQKTVRINSGYVAPVSTSTTVAEKITTTDDDNDAPGSSSGSAVAGGSSVVTINKSILPAVSVSTSPSASSSTSDSTASSGTTTYTYRKGYVSN